MRKEVDIYESKRAIPLMKGVGLTLGYIATLTRYTEKAVNSQVHPPPILISRMRFWILYPDSLQRTDVENMKTEKTIKAIAVFDEIKMGGRRMRGRCDGTYYTGAESQIRQTPKTDPHCF